MAVIKGLHAKLIAEEVARVMDKKHYDFFENGKFNVNIIGIRSSEKSSNTFNDTMLLIYKNKKSEWEVVSAVVTTDPGEKYLVEPINNKGTAILVPGQYKKVYKVDTHAASNKKFAHEALCQRGATLRVYRDNDRDRMHDHNPDSIDEGWFGVNIHRAKASGETSYIGAYSAGCQVFKNATDFKVFMDVVRRSRDLYGNSFTYTLLEEEDFEV